ncbi:acyl-CoA dehydrogenase [Mycolicibacterium austroafricanum]|uniref:Acyl-CoA dehydrogenase n=1 Tax=Mycolicibacterium austroafricanum TaxID=39687 RepID=A0ABT8H768_MYCAO|nr:acyl-CoA dehydrogenase [Mycolicibacterium austroafricanum]MDN4516604.1 acyl-CoA dehydrogenase [Mycolicibacterium austroafricanum]QRZ05024.1 acyl-CoA dehydrogenase [Mycolicibacterium austroafricanum]QZT68729.1 acyl-CoA dehydrogenase [Mycolicibacterium austroafricanum]
MGHYKSNVRDLEFNLFEVLALEKVLATGEFGDLDGPSVREMLHEAAKLAEGPLAEAYAETDRNPPSFDPATHVVSIPEPFKKSFRAWLDGEWFRVGMAEEIGGVPAPAMLEWAINELALGAQPAAFMYAAGPKMADIINAIGNEEQRHWAALMIERNWGATMVLTEPDAGSDVGAGRTKAVQQADGTWHIDGVKRFITNGDADDLFENILHVVLARPEGAGPGTKGLSLFLVPKFHFDPQTGEPGERNGVFVTGLEHKMGLKASATCELTFGQHGVPAVGWLVNDTHNGIAQMFKVIEYARMMVGTKAMSTLSTGYLNALEYAKTRVQGADMTQMTDKSAPRVTIIHHPDVRRALLIQKAYAEGLRALYLYTAAHQDPAAADIVSGADAAMADRVNDLLLPIVKGVGSERAYQCLTESLQTFGGSGFLQDYPIEQYIRDAKIDSLYEGTTAIQAQDFFFRKIARDQGGALLHVVSQLRRFLDDLSAREELATERALLGTAVDDVQEMVAAMTKYLVDSQQNARELYRLGLESVPFLLAVGDLLLGWLLLHQAETALAALEGDVSERDRAFYTGKVATAKFFARNVLPRLTAQRGILQAVDLTAMELSEAGF